MRVLNVLFDDRYAGPLKQIIEVAKGLRSEGIETVLCLPDGRGNAEAFAQRAGLEIRRVSFRKLPVLQPWRLASWTVLLLRDVRRFIALYRHEAPDVIHVNGAVFWPPAFAARLAGIPLVWHLQDTVVPRKLAPFIGKVAHTAADELVVAAKAVAVHYSVQNVPHHVVYPPVSAEYFEIERLGTLPTNDTIRRVGLVANWNPLKGIEYFIEAMGKVRDRFHGNLSIELIGPRLSTQIGYAQKIDRTIDSLGLGGILTQHGFVSSPAYLLETMDLMVLSSISEGAPMVVIEAMAAGVPVVATDVGGARELLCVDTERPAGVLVPPRNPEVMALAIQELLEDPGRATFLGENGRHWAETNYTVNRCVEKHVAVYRAAINAKQAGDDGLGCC